MSHPSEQVNDGVIIQSSATARIDTVDSICFDQFTGLLTCGRLGLSGWTRFFRPMATLARLRIRRTLLKDTRTPSTLTRWCHITSAQRFRCARTASTSLTIFWLTALEYVLGILASVGIRHLQAASRKTETGVRRTCDWLGRLSLVNCTCSLSLSHFCFHYQIVLR